MRFVVTASAGFVVLVLLVSPLPGLAAGAGQNDAGKGTDASDTRGAATSITPNARYFGQLVATTDEHDWYRFSVPSVSGVEGRLLIEALLLTDPGSDYGLELWRPSDTSEPVQTGIGPTAVRAVRYSADQNGFWNLHVTGTTTGRYEFSLRLVTENDSNLTRDAVDHATFADLGLTMPGSPNAGITVRGNLTAGDTGDLYRFQRPSGATRITAVLHYGAAEILRLRLVYPAEPAVHLESTRDGVGMSSIVLDNPPGSSTDYWGLRVTRSSGAATTTAAYTLHLRTTSSDDPDAGTGSDAPDSFGLAPTLPRGLHTGTLRTFVPADTADVYKLASVAEGQTIRIGTAGLSSATAPVTARPLLVLELFDPDLESAGVRNVCDGAGGIAFTTTKSGNWYVRVAEGAYYGANSPCGANVNREGSYAIHFDLLRPHDVAAGDAPPGVSGAPDIPDPLLSTGWTDPGDRIDVYRIGTAAAGGVIRAGLHAAASGIHLRVNVFDQNGTLIGAPVTSTDGVARLYVAVSKAGTYWLRIEQVSLAGSALTSGYHRFYARVAANEPPSPVTLNQPPTGDVGRNSVRLSWSQSPDLDFVRYEVHGSRSTGFAPSASTLRTTVAEVTQTSAQVSGLDSGQTYQFLVRVVDEASLASDSNRVSVTLTSGPAGNRAPTLTGPSVDPQSGDASTVFTYRVTYTDADGDPPTQRRVFIDAVPFDMTAQGTNYASGVAYQLQTTLAPGNHEYFFQFSDGEFTARSPAVTGTHPGPTVTQASNRPPTVTANATPHDGSAPLQVKFRADASDPDGDPLSYSWDFDNRNGIQTDASQREPTHTYSTPGTYIASVRVSDNKGATSSSQVEVNVRPPSNKAPYANATGFPVQGDAPLEVQFDANATDPDGTIVKYSWDFDSSNGIQQESALAKPKYTYSKAGSFVATVTVEDNGGAKATGQVTIVVRTVSNSPPSVVVSASPDHGPAPLAVAFTADAVDPDGDAVTVEWDFDTSNGVSVQAVGAQASHTYSQPGTYSVMAVVTDAKGAKSTGTTTVRVGSPAPAAPVVFIRATPTAGNPPLEVQFQADTASMERTPTAFSWDFGDHSEPASGRNVVHLFAVSGVYTVVLTVTDDQGATYESTIDITVNAKKRTSPGAEIGTLVAAVLVAALRARSGRRPG